MWKTACMVFALLICLTGQAEAHFGMIIPSSSTVMEKKEASLKLDISFSHPMEMQGMDMQQPQSLTVTVDGKTENLKPLLKPVSIIGHQAWQATYSVKRPGVYQFAMEPAPYFEQAEQKQC